MAKAKKVEAPKVEATATLEQTNPEKSNGQSKSLATLLGSISYESKDDYEKFLGNLTLEHSVIVLIASANFAQSKGIFNLDEAELVAKAIKKLSSKPEPIASEK